MAKAEETVEKPSKDGSTACAVVKEEETKSRAEKVDKFVPQEVRNFARNVSGKLHF